MVRENEITEIAESELSFIKEELAKSNSPFTLEELAKKLAFKKNASQLNQDVKIYDPICTYKEGDLICKKYDEPLTVSSKGTEHFKGEVVLRVTKTSRFESYNCDMMEVDYTGGGTFRRHVDYMKKNNAQILLPCNCNGKAIAPKTLEKESDPRLNQIPMTERDLKKLERNLRSELTKSSQYFHWNDFWQLKEKQPEIKEAKIKKIQDFLLKTQKSAFTTELVENFLNLKPQDELFELSTLSLNSLLEKKYKKRFVFVSPEKWGKWHLKEILQASLKDLPLSASKAPLPALEKGKTPDLTLTQDSTLRFYLTWREVLSGGLKIPKHMSREFSGSCEYTFSSSEEGKDYTVYYYPSSFIFVGLKEFYEKHNVAQGSSLSLERKGPTRFALSLKISKKKQSVPKVAYDPKKDQFSLSGEEFFTFSAPNKIIHLERETLQSLFPFYEQRKNLDLRELLILTFKNFSLKAEKRTLHYQRVFHLVDMLKQTTLEDVELTLLSSPEFTSSEKKEGVFYYTEKIKTEEEIKPEEPVAKPPAAPEEAPKEKAGEPLPEIGTVGDILPSEESVQLQFIEEEKKEEAVEEEIVEPSVPLEEKAKEERPKKEKEAKKKKEKVKKDEEKAPRRRKSVRKVIEEQIELEESEMEALFAMKAEKKREDEEIVQEAGKKGTKEKKKAVVSKDAKFGLFAEKLKSALDQKKEKKE